MGGGGGADRELLSLPHSGREREGWEGTERTAFVDQFRERERAGRGQRELLSLTNSGRERGLGGDRENCFR